MDTNLRGGHQKSGTARIRRMFSIRLFKQQLWHQISIAQWTFNHSYTAFSGSPVWKHVLANTIPSPTGYCADIFSLPPVRGTFAPKQLSSPWPQPYQMFLTLPRVASASMEILPGSFRPVLGSFPQCASGPQHVLPLTLPHSIRTVRWRQLAGDATITRSTTKCIHALTCVTLRQVSHVRNGRTESACSRYTTIISTLSIHGT